MLLAEQTSGKMWSGYLILRGKKKNEFSQQVLETKINLVLCQNIKNIKNGTKTKRSSFEILIFEVHFAHWTFEPLDYNGYFGFKYNVFFF